MPDLVLDHRRCMQGASGATAAMHAVQALPELAPSQETAMRELHDRYLALRLDSQALAAAHPGMHLCPQPNGKW